MRRGAPYRAVRCGVICGDETFPRAALSSESDGGGRARPFVETTSMTLAFDDARSSCRAPATEQPQQRGAARRDSTRLGYGAASIFAATRQRSREASRLHVHVHTPYGTGVMHITRIAR